MKSFLYLLYFTLSSCLTSTNLINPLSRDDNQLKSQSEAQLGSFFNKPKSSLILLLSSAPAGLRQCPVGGHALALAGSDSCLVLI